MSNMFQIIFLEFGASVGMQMWSIATSKLRLILNFSPSSYSADRSV